MCVVRQVPQNYDKSVTKVWAMNLPFLAQNCHEKSIRMLRKNNFKINPFMIATNALQSCLCLPDTIQPALYLKFGEWKVIPLRAMKLILLPNPFYCRLPTFKSREIWAYMELSNQNAVWISNHSTNQEYWRLSWDCLFSSETCKIMLATNG